MAQGVSGGLSDDDGLGDLPRMPNGNPYEEAFFDADWGPVESSDEATWIVLTEYDKETGEIARHHYLHAAEETESKGSEGTVGVCRLVMMFEHSVALTNPGRLLHCFSRSGERVASIGQQYVIDCAITQVIHRGVQPEGVESSPGRA